MKQPLHILIVAAALLLSVHAAENVRLARSAATPMEDLSPEQMTALKAGLAARGINFHPAQYWNVVK